MDRTMDDDYPPVTIQELVQGTQELDQGHNVDTVYLNFSKVFDSVPHKGLLVKMEDWNYRENPWMVQTFLVRSQAKSGAKWRELSNLGVSPHDVTWSKVTMTCDKHICVRCNDIEGHTEDKLMVLDLTSVDNCLQFLPYKADGAMVSPPSNNGGGHLLALKVGETIMVSSLDRESQTKYSCEISGLQFWTWVGADTLAFVTDNAVLHWTLEEGSTPQEVFCRDERLAYSEIVGYKVDSSMKWFTVTGLLPQTDGIYGLTQLFYSDKKLTQCITAQAVVFAEYCFHGNKFASTVLCVAGRESNGHGKVDIIELEPHIPGNLSLGNHCDTIPFSGSGDKYDFPVSIQASSSFGLLYIITKYGLLYLSDMEAATCLCCVRISTSIVFTSALSLLSQGIIIVNRAGQARLPWEEMVKLNKGSIFIITETQFAIQSQVQAIDIKAGRLIHHVEKVLKKPANAERLRRVLPLVPVLEPV